MQMAFGFPMDGHCTAHRRYTTWISGDGDWRKTAMEIIQRENIITRRVEDDEEQHQQVYTDGKGKEGITLARKANDSSGASAAAEELYAPLLQALHIYARYPKELCALNVYTHKRSERNGTEKEEHGRETRNRRLYYIASISQPDNVSGHHKHYRSWQPPAVDA